MGYPTDEDLSEHSERQLLLRIVRITKRLEQKVDHIMSATDPLAPEIATLTTDVGALATQNASLITLVQKLAAAAGVNTAADLAAIQAADAQVTTITAADVAAVAAQAAPAAPATPAAPEAPSENVPPTTT